MSKICLITGNHPRHIFFVDQLFSSNMISCWIIEERENFVPQPPPNLSENLKKLFIHHFNERDRVENEFFGNTLANKNIPTLKVSKDTLNSKETIRFVNKHHPALVISYGCHKLSQIFMNSISALFWNTHGGLSPKYRGVITHFWPSYFLEPQMTGITLHETTDFLDGGGIIFQTAAPMVFGDTLHRLAARNVVHFVSELKPKLINLDFSNLPAGHNQKGYGRVFAGNDWRAEHLKLIYDVYEDRIVDLFIEGKISGREPNLISII